MKKLKEDTACNTKTNRFYQDLTCYKPDPIIQDIQDMWDYKNTHRGALDIIPYTDQEHSAVDNWYNQDRNFDTDVKLDIPDNSKSNSIGNEAFGKFATRREIYSSALDDTNPIRGVYESISNIDAWIDTVFSDFMEMIEEKPEKFRPAMRIANRVSKEEFEKTIDMKVKHDVLAEALKELHAIMVDSQ